MIFNQLPNLLKNLLIRHRIKFAQNVTGHCNQLMILNLKKKIAVLARFKGLLPRRRF